ncbi:MAG: quinone oxidoreductase [Alphaproteobacteria bacterium]
MVKAVVMHEPGGPEVLKWEDVTVGEPGTGEARVRNTAVGLNFLDTLFRSGAIPMDLPAILGWEAAGVVEAIGGGVTSVAPGMRVAYHTPNGCYAEERLIKADELVPLPDGISEDQGAASILKGMTAQYLLRLTTPVKAGDTVLVHAAAGGVGLFMCQWAKHLGATVIGTVGTDEKAALAKAHGCDHPVVYTRDDFLPVVQEVTGGVGCDAVYDSVGAETIERSWQSVRPHGTVASFGMASGPITPEQLAKQPTDRYFIRTTLQAYNATREDLLANAKDFFDVVESGAVKVTIGQTFALKDAAKAHAALVGRATTGSTVLKP